MRKRKNAFTLIELLAVIVILAIIALIATPIILGIVEDAKKDAFLRSVELLVGTTDIDITNKIFEEEYTYTITDGDISNLEVGVKNTTGMNGNITYDVNGNESYAIHNGVYCVIKTDNNTEVSDYEEGKCIIPPVLTENDISFITFNDLEYIYDGTEKELVVNNLSDEFSVTYVNNKGTNVGSYNATAIITGKDHRGSITKEATLTIQKASLTLKAEDKTSKQGEEIEELTYQVVSGTIYGNDELNINLTKEDGTEIGTYNIFVNAENTNYEIILVNGIYTITVGFTSESCFAFSNGSITNYYDYEGNNSSNKACPRDVIIPETINGATVTTVASNALKSKNLTSVQFSSTLTSIGSNAFRDNNLSGELDLSNTKITSIGSFAFSGSSDGSTNQITSIKFPNSLISIEHSAFRYNKITALDLPSGLPSIGNYAFENNKLSGELDLSNTNIITIGASAFSSNPIEKIKFSNNLKTIGEDAFRYNKLRGELDLSNTGITSIGNSAFRGDTNQITSIKFPNTLTSIGNFAFYRNKINGELDLSNTVITVIGKSTFEGNLDGTTNQITSVKFPSTLESIGHSAFYYNKLSGELDLSMCTNLTTIESEAFSDGLYSSLNQITSLKLPSSIVTIEYNAFAYNALSGELDLSHLTNLISLSGFERNEIQSINLPSSVTSIEDGAFAWNKLSGELDLSKLTNLTSIGNRAFYGETNYSNGILTSKNGFTNVKFSSSLISIGDYAFQYNKLNDELDLSNLTNLTSIGSGSFADNKLSGELDLSKLTNLTSIGTSAFAGNSVGSSNQITSIKLSNSLITIGSNALQYNPVSSVTFYGRSDLTGVTLGSSALGSFNTANITFITE